MLDERWLPVVGYEGFYEISDLGRVKSLSRTVRNPHNRGGTIRLRERILKQAKTKGGKLQVCLSNQGQRVRLVHQLVLEAFVGPCPPGMESLHANDIGVDNRLENLRWGTRSQNLFDQVRNGRHVSQGGRRSDYSVRPSDTGKKLTADKVLTIRSALASSESRLVVAAQYGVTQTTIRQIAQRKTWKHI